jgi:succinyl-CoA synthetase alpha subunit
VSVLLDESARVVILGITGRFGVFSARDLTEYGTKVVAGVSPGRGGEIVEGVPVFGSVADALRDCQPNCALVYVPAPAALDAVLVTIEAGCKLVVYPGDGLPVQDAMEMRAAALANGTALIGPNSPGLISPGKAKLGFMPSFCYRRGPIGLISRSGSLSYEAAHRLSTAGLGQTTSLGIGGDPVKGINAAEAIELLHSDPETRALIYLGEIGGTDEYAVVDYARRSGAKPVAALLVGRTAPRGKKMGHAAAMIDSYSDTWQAKVEALEHAGVRVARSLDLLVDAAANAIELAGGQRESLADQIGLGRGEIR